MGSMWSNEQFTSIAKSIVGGLTTKREYRLSIWKLDTTHILYSHIVDSFGCEHRIKLYVDRHCHRECRCAMNIYKGRLGAFRIVFFFFTNSFQYKHEYEYIHLTELNWTRPANIQWTNCCCSRNSNKCRFVLLYAIYLSIENEWSNGVSLYIYLPLYGIGGW